LLHVIEQIGAFAGLAAFLGLAVLALLSFAHGRDIRRLRDWAGSAPERDAERKEATSTVAAQRAEELRALESNRTAELEAINQREERRRRRDAGKPELSRGERARAGLSQLGERISEPRYLVGLFLVVLVVAGGAVYLVTSGSSEGSGKDGKAASGKVEPGEVEVTVLNGTAVSGLAASYGEKVKGKGFKLGAVTDSPSSFAESVVMFKQGHAAEAHKVAKQLQISKLQSMSEEIASASAGANVAVIVGEDNAETAG
jgi:LytR cell envelope-related transcriptional attenuator